MNELAVKEPRDMTAEELGGEIRMLGMQMARMTVDYGCEIGRRLVAAKEKVPHGEWLNWLETETGLSRSTAARMMKIYEQYGDPQSCLFGASANVATLKNLSISNALRLLSVPEEEREEFAAKVDAEHISARELEQAIRERDEARKALSEEREAAEGTEIKIAEAQEKAAEALEKLKDEREKRRDAEAELKELKSRPVEVAVQTVVDEDAVKRAAEDARAAEKQKNAAVIAALRDQLDAAEKQKKDAEEKAAKAKEKAKTAAEAAKKEAEDAAAKARAEAEQAKKEAEELRKKLISAESGAGEAAIFAKAAQENFFAAINKIEEIGGRNEDTARKLADGIISILEELTEAARELRKGME